MVTAPASDVRAILVELDRRLQELEEELASVGAPPPPPPPQPWASGATTEAREARPPATDAPTHEPEPERQDASEPSREPAPPADPAAATLEAIRAAVPNEVDVVVSAPDALVLRVALAESRAAAEAEGPEGGR